MTFRTALIATMLIAGAASASVLPTTAVVTTNDFADFTGTAVFGAYETSGFAFTANSAFNIGRLGVFDSGQNGLAQSHQVGLWDASGALLASTTVGSGRKGSLIGLYRYGNVAPVSVKAGSTYYVGAYTGDLSDGYFCCSTPGSVDSRIGNLEGGVSNSTNFAAPNFSTPLWDYANFTISTAPGGRGAAVATAPGGPGVASVPEPSAWAIMLIGMGLAGGALRRRRGVPAT